MIKDIHNVHTCRAIVVSCMDFRLRIHLRQWAIKFMDKNGFDRVAIAGGVKNLSFIVKQIELSYKFHHIREVYLINHEDCGAYGSDGTFEKHQKDLLLAQKVIKNKFPHHSVNPLFLKLNGEFVKVDEENHFAAIENI